MRNSLSMWLTGIILLTVVAFLAVFKPITFGARKDPAQRAEWLRPVGAKASFDAKSDIAPDPTASLKVGGLKLFLYVPQHDLNLDMDLRGGMRVVLQAANQAEFSYRFKKEARLTTSGEANRKAQALSDAVRSALGPAAATAKVYVTQETVTIVTLAERRDIADAQFKQVDGVVRATFVGTNVFADAPDKENGKYYRPADEATMKTVREIIEARINQTGLSEATTFVEGSNQLVVQIPGVSNPDQVHRILGKTAELELMLLDQSITPGREDNGKATLSRGGVEISSEEGLRSAMLVVRGRDLDAGAIGTGFDDMGKPNINFGLKAEAARNFENITGGNIGRHLAIVLDGEVISAPVIKGAIGSQGQISGNFTDKSAKELAAFLKAGALPVPLTEVASSQVSASLGADSVQKSMFAGLVGLALVLIFMAVYYRLPGLLANSALVVYIFLSLAVLRMFDATLSLPGIAGIIISIGMAVDANVIIFERLKEELRAGKPIETAIDVAFKRAWTAILDSNIASLITGAVLWSFGTGAVKGFAITLVIGVAVSLFTAVTVTRLFMKLMARTKAGHNMANYGI